MKLPNIIPLLSLLLFLSICNHPCIKEDIPLSYTLQQELKIKIITSISEYPITTCHKEGFTYDSKDNLID